MFPGSCQQFRHTDTRDLYGTNADPDVWPTDEHDYEDDEDDGETSDYMSSCSCSDCEEVWDLSMFNIDEIMYDGSGSEFFRAELPAAMIPYGGQGWLD